MRTPELPQPDPTKFSAQEPEDKRVNSQGVSETSLGFSAQDQVQLAFEAMKAEVPEGLIDGPLLKANHETGVIIWAGPDKAINLFRVQREQIQDTLSIVSTVEDTQSNS